MPPRGVPTATARGRCFRRRACPSSTSTWSRCLARATRCVPAAAATPSRRYSSASCTSAATTTPEPSTRRASSTSCWPDQRTGLFHERPTEDHKMADETPAAANGADTQAQQPNLALQGVYLKDCSYEAPLGPRAEGNWQPQINLDLATTSNPIQDDLREVVLTVTVSAKQGDKTLFLVEV